MQMCGFFLVYSYLRPLAINQWLMPVALKLLTYHYLCIWYVRDSSFKIGEGYSEERRKEYVFYRIDIRMKFTKIKNKNLFFCRVNKQE
jgi:hypothetical protein